MSTISVSGGVMISFSFSSRNCSPGKTISRAGAVL
jgi:hypothetical protein